MAEIQGSLYMHMSSLKDVEKEALEKKQDEQTAKIIKQQRVIDRANGNTTFEETF